jgi:hypothetical protein
MVLILLFHYFLLFVSWSHGPAIFIYAESGDVEVSYQISLGFFRKKRRDYRIRGETLHEKYTLIWNGCPSKNMLMEILERDAS